MKKLISMLGILVLVMSIMPMAFAEEASIGGGFDVEVSDTGSGCNDAVIYKDHTARVWQPNDQTIYTADAYGELVTDHNHMATHSAYINGSYALPLRQNYVFQGETLKYFIIVEDIDGANSIDSVYMEVNGNIVGACAKVNAFDYLTAFIGDNGQTISTYDSSTMNSYICTWVIPSAGVLFGLSEIDFHVDDLTGETLGVCSGPETIDSMQSDWLYVNPDLTAALSLVGAIVFNGGNTVAEGSTAMSNTVRVENTAPGGSGVIMDMYIASKDYFTDVNGIVDLTGEPAICGAGNGIRYDQFSYYATKGAVNSGANNNDKFALGEMASGLCVADATEFTPLPSHSGHIEDMCRIINHNELGSLLAQGSSMSLTFKVSVPKPCKGEFTDGQFFIVGRVI